MKNKEETEPDSEGKLIQKHLENINMDAWYFIYQNYVNPTSQNITKKEKSPNID